MDQDRSLEADKTLELLKQHDIIEPKVRGLILLSEDHEKKCGILNIEEIIFLLDNSKKDSEGLKAYKEKQWKKRILACKETWKNDLKKDVESLTGDEIKLSSSLKTNMKMNFPDFSNRKLLEIQESQGFMSGMFSYFEQNIDHDLQQVIAGDNRKQLYKSDFTRLFTNLCENVLIKLGHSMYLYEAIENHPETGVGSDEFVLDWLETFKICQVISKKEKAISKGLNSLLKSKNPIMGVGERLRNCISGNCKRVTS